MPTPIEGDPGNGQRHEACHGRCDQLIGAASRSQQPPRSCRGMHLMPPEEARQETDSGIRDGAAAKTTAAP